MIRLYCVGIQFNKEIPFMPDLGPNGEAIGNGIVGTFMSGHKILEFAAANYQLGYVLSPPPPAYPLPGHVLRLSYTPKVGDRIRQTFDVPFPFYGKELVLTEVLRGVGEISEVLQYTVASTDPFNKPVPRTLKNSGRIDPTSADPFLKAGGDAQFGDNGFPDEVEIRLRLLSIYCTK